MHFYPQVHGLYVSVEIALLRKRSSTHTTRIFFLPSVNRLVCFQAMQIQKGLEAKIALMGPLSSMPHLVPFEALRAGESLWTDVTLVRLEHLWFLMCRLHMLSQSGCRGERFGAKLTLEGIFFVKVYSPMSGQDISVHESLLTNIALEWPLS